ncbi:hypothetical protein ACTXT7_007060 [Hymenolepis weldensis]
MLDPDFAGCIREISPLATVLDAGARLLRRLQKEALLAPDPSSLGSSQNQQAQQQQQQGQSLPGTSGLLSNEMTSNGDAESRRHPTSSRSVVGGGVKFPSRFGPIKTRRTVPAAKRRQVTSSPSIPTTANVVAMSSIPVTVQEPLYLNGDHDDLGLVRNRSMGFGNEMEQQQFECSFLKLQSVTGLSALQASPLVFVFVSPIGAEEESVGSLAHSEMPVFPESLADVQFVVNNLEPGGKSERDCKLWSE